MAGSKPIGILITGDATHAVKAIKLTQDEVNALGQKVHTVAGSMKSSWTSGFSDMAVTGAKWAAGTIAAAATAGAAMLRMSLNTAEATGVLATKLGVTSEALSKLQYAAKLSDVSSQSLETGLKRLAKSLTDAADPANASAKAFRALGLEATELLKLPADKQLGVIADRLNLVENASQRAALAQKIFGRSGIDLIPILQEGSAGIAKLGDEAQRFGVVISGDMTRRAQAFNDSLDRIKFAAQGLGLQLADSLLPAMQGMTDEILTLAQNKEAMAGIAKALEFMGKTALKAAEGWGLLTAAMVDFFTTSNAERLAEINDELKEATERRAFLGDLLGGKGHADEMRALSEKIAALEKEKTALQSVAKAAEVASLEEIKVTARKKEVAITTRQVTEALQKSTTAWVDDRDAVMESIIAQESASRATQATTIQVQAQATAIAEATEVTDPWAEALAGAVERIDSAFADAWKNVGDGFSEMLDGLKSALSQALAEMAHQLITRPLVMQIGAALGLGGASGAASAATGGGGLSSLLSGGSSILGKLGGGLSGLGASAYGKLFDIASGLGLDSVGNAAFSKMSGYMGGSLGSNLMTAGGDILGGMAGSFAANKLFSSRESATGGILGTAGGALGSIYGPLGSAVGAFVGQAVDKLLGGSDFSGKRVKLGIGTGPMVEGDSDWKDVRTLSSGLQIGNLNRRTKDAGMSAEEMNAFFSTFDTLDATLTTLSEALGTNVSLAGRSLPGMPQSYDGGTSGEAFFGSLAKGELRANLKDAPKEFVKQWIEAVSDQFEESLRPLLRQIDGTVEEMLSEFEAIGNLRSTYVDAVDRMKAVLSSDVSDVLDAMDKRSRTVYELWNEQSDLVRWFSNTITSAQDYQNFAGMVEQRYAIELELIGQIRDALDQVSNAFGDSIERIKLDLMEGDEQRYNYFKQQADALAASLATLSDPTAITNTIGEIERLANAAYGLLDDTQKKGMGQEFLDFFEEAQQLATDRLNAVLADMGPEGKTGGAVQASIEAAMARWSAAFIAEAQTMFASSASAQQQAASTQQAAANTMVAAANSIPTNISVSVDLSSLNLAEVNV